MVDDNKQAVNLYISRIRQERLAWAKYHLACLMKVPAHIRDPVQVLDWKTVIRRGGKHWNEP